MRYFVFKDPYALIIAPYKSVARKLYSEQVIGDMGDTEGVEVIEVERGHAIAAFRRENQDIPMTDFLNKFDQYQNETEGLVLLVDSSLM